MAEQAGNFGSFQSGVPSTGGQGQGLAQVFTPQAIGLDTTSVQRAGAAIGDAIQQQRKEDAAKKRAEAERADKWRSLIGKEGTTTPKLTAARERLYNNMEQDMLKSDDPSAVYAEYYPRFQALHLEDVNAAKEANTLFFDPEKSGINKLRKKGEEGWLDGQSIFDETYGTNELTEEEQMMIDNGNIASFSTSLKSNFSPNLNPELTVASDVGFETATTDALVKYAPKFEEEGIPMFRGSDGRIDFYETISAITNPAKKKVVIDAISKDPQVQKAHKWDYLQANNLSPLEYDPELAVEDMQEKIGSIVDAYGSRSTKTYATKETGTGEEEKFKVSETVVGEADAEKIANLKTKNYTDLFLRLASDEKVGNEAAQDEEAKRLQQKFKGDLQNRLENTKDLKSYQIINPKRGEELKPINIDDKKGVVQEVYTNPEGRGFVILGVEKSISTRDKDTGVTTSTKVVEPVIIDLNDRILGKIEQLYDVDLVAPPQKETSTRENVAISNYPQDVQGRIQNFAKANGLDVTEAIKILKDNNKL